LCGDTYKNYIALGCNDGNLLAYNTTIMKCVFGYGASQSSINAVKIVQEGAKIIVGGESGVGLVMNL
jgi:hypothetical protein